MLLYIVVAFAIFALFNYRMAVFILAPLALFLQMFPVVDKQVFSVLDCCCIALSALLPFKTNFVSKIKTYPFFIPSILVFGSYCLTNVLAEPHWPSTIFVFNTIYIFPFIVWCVVDEKKNAVQLLLCFMVYFAFCAVYALVELALNENVIIVKLLKSRIVNENVINYTEIRFGFKRLQSIFCTPMSMGLAMAAFAYVMYEYKKLRNETNLFYICLMAACFILPWLTGARSVFLPALIIMIPVFFKAFKNGQFMLLKIGALGAGVILMGNWVMTLVDSFINSDTAVSGSSLDMRLMQFAVIVPFFLNSPIWGNGYAYTWSFVKAVDADLLGAESIWLQILVDFGLVGAMAYISCIISMAKCLSKRYGKRGTAMPVAVICAYTLSTFLGLELNYFFILCIMLIKFQDDLEDDPENNLAQLEKENL